MQYKTYALYICYLHRASLFSLGPITLILLILSTLPCQITRNIIIGTCLIIAGCIILVVFGNHTSEVFTGHELLDLYKEPPYIVYLVLGGVSTVVCYGIYYKGRRITDQANQKGGQVWKGWDQLLPVTYSIFSALIGTQVKAGDKRDCGKD